jgi:hypothetical protein
MRTFICRRFTTSWKRRVALKMAARSAGLQKTSIASSETSSRSKVLHIACITGTATWGGCEQRSQKGVPEDRLCETEIRLIGLTAKSLEKFDVLRKTSLIRWFTRVQLTYKLMGEKEA